MVSTLPTTSDSTRGRYFSTHGRSDSMEEGGEEEEEEAGDEEEAGGCLLGEGVGWVRLGRSSSSMMSSSSPSTASVGRAAP